MFDICVKRCAVFKKNLLNVKKMPSKSLFCKLKCSQMHTWHLSLTLCIFDCSILFSRCILPRSALEMKSWLSGCVYYRPPGEFERGGSSRDQKMQEARPSVWESVSKNKVFVLLFEVLLSIKDVLRQRGTLLLILLFTYGSMDWPCSTCGLLRVRMLPLGKIKD